MRLKQIASMAAGNRFSVQLFGGPQPPIREYAASAEDFHTAVPKDLDLDEIFRLEEMRTIRLGSQFKQKSYQQMLTRKALQTLQKGENP